jgi:hypothetical protein
MAATNRNAEIALGRKITEARAEQTRIQRLNFARKQQEERDEEEKRRQEIEAIGRGYQIPQEPQKPAPEAVEEVRPLPSIPLPPIPEVEIAPKRYVKK